MSSEGNGWVVVWPLDGWNEWAIEAKRVKPDRTCIGSLGAVVLQSVYFVCLLFVFIITTQVSDGCNGSDGSVDDVLDDWTLDSI